MHIEEHGDATCEGACLRGWDTNGIGAEEMEIGALYDTRHWLDGRTGQVGSRPPLGELSLLPEELLPRGALDLAGSGCTLRWQRLSEAAEQDRACRSHIGAGHELCENRQTTRHANDST
ncbi:MAG: hypothetical protein OXC01_20940 [Immundisolibacterales bacterium]|nr:hypothetical protein [Immundisolibacterales bacterium]